jgi:hypothetical protein
VCPAPECLERGLSRGRLGHAFRKPSEASASLVADILAAGRRESNGSPAEASTEEALLCEVGGTAIGNVDTITERA